MKPIKIIIALMVFATALSAQAAPLLNGLALEQQFNKDRYIAAVYSDTLADSASVLLDSNTSRRIEIRVVADSLSARRFRNQWMESIAINNAGDTLSKQAEDMVSFANLFKGRLYKGDRLSADFSGNSGVTTIALNGVELGTIRDREFFNTLLRAWVGPIPPSTDFRDGLLAAGDVAPSLLGSYELLGPSDERIAQVRESTVATEEQPQSASAPQAEKPIPSKPKLAADIPPPTLAGLQNTPASAAAAAPAQPEPRPQQSQPKPKTAATRPAPAPKEELEEDEDEGPLTADMLLARQIYHSILLRHTFKNTRYPKRAQERGQEGSVRLNVVIDPRGNVREIQTLQESRFSSLNRAAEDAVERASPYPAAPPQLAREAYQFTVPITFRLPD